MGRNSVIPSTTPKIIAWKMVMGYYSSVISITPFGHAADASRANFLSSSVNVLGSLFKETVPVSRENISGAMEVHKPQLMHLSVCRVIFMFLLIF